MNIQDFIVKYREAFGQVASLPIAFGYSDSAVAEIRKMPKCLVVSIRKAIIFPWHARTVSSSAYPGK